MVKATQRSVEIFIVALVVLHLLCQECVSINLDGLMLLKFRSRVEDDPQNALASWNPQDDIPCDWDGVGCIDGRVAMLNLKDLSLKGKLGPELGSLSHLEALALSDNMFSGVIPKEISQLTSLEILDLRNNNFNGIIPQEIGNMKSLKCLLLYNNSFQGDLPSIENLRNQNDCKDLGSSIEDINQERAQRSNPDKKERSNGSNLSASLPKRSVLRNKNPAGHVRRRRLFDLNSNLAAPSANAPIPSTPAPVPSTGSGSFPAMPKVVVSDKNPPSPSPPQVSLPNSPPGNTSAVSGSLPSTPPGSILSRDWFYIILLPAVALAVTLLVCIAIACRRKGGSTIGPWKTGLSGQLQRAFVTGVPQLRRSELEGACEEFSNIVVTHRQYTVYKGTLSNGVEIAVVSTAVSCPEDWSKHAEDLFRKKIESLSRVNHKNFINLLGYCQEEEPFMRMMVHEYAPNGTLYEHLHDEDFDHIDWTARMRIIMGIAYCVQHMHELNPPIVHPDLRSYSVLLSEDYAAKIMDMSVWLEVFEKERNSACDELDDRVEQQPADIPGNVYSFGMLMLETISGKVPYSDKEGFLVNLAYECKKQNRSIGTLLDPALKSHKEKELEAVWEAIQECIQPDPWRRPKMREVTTKLKEVLAISPEGATPRLSPLWWAELEILSDPS